MISKQTEGRSKMWLSTLWYSFFRLFLNCLPLPPGKLLSYFLILWYVVRECGLILILVLVEQDYKGESVAQVPIMHFKSKLNYFVIIWLWKALFLSTSMVNQEFTSIFGKVNLKSYHLDLLYYQVFTQCSCRCYWKAIEIGIKF